MEDNNKDMRRFHLKKFHPPRVAVVENSGGVIRIEIADRAASREALEILERNNFTIYSDAETEAFLFPVL